MLKIEKLSKTYDGKVNALEDVSLQVGAGEFVVILGKSGSGKSTLLRCINRLVEPTGGRIFLGDEEITTASPKKLRLLRRKIGMIFQQYNLVPRLSVLTNTVAGTLGRVPGVYGLFNHFPQDAPEQARTYLDELELGDKLYQRADALSGGQAQRVGIARVLMQEPELILADEPVSSLDPVTARVILNILKKINRERGVAILCNLHLPELAVEYGTRVVALKSGQVVYDGEPKLMDNATVERIYEEKE